MNEPDTIALESGDDCCSFKRESSQTTAMFTEHLKRVKSALKRSFEVEEDTSTNPSPLSRRTTNPLRSATSSTSSRFHDMRSLNSESTSRHASDSSSNQSSPKSGMGRIELSRARIPEAVSRRTEISIDISSKQVDSSPSPGITRFGLKRPEVSLQSKATDGPLYRRAEGNHSRPQEPPTPPRRADPPISASRIPEVSQRRAEPPSPLEISAPTRRAEMHINRQLDTPSPARESENSFTSAASITPNFDEYKTPPAVHEAPLRPQESKSHVL
ncbi:septin-9 isoform X1 [Carassius gibelio]|uniref:septin-9 isoform X1 n=1 Tax=Carassius gibelio TaxID=101364 RepID=UPI002278C0E7|nr:septin-9 isoform X1 [Carassius gibelio]